MKVLGLETSCDETGIAIYDTDKGLLTHKIYTQIAQHAEYGGVVPELASRDHVRKTLPLIDEVLADANLKKSDLDAVAYTSGPGLVGALNKSSGITRCPSPFNSSFTWLSLSIFRADKITFAPCSAPELPPGRPAGSGWPIERGVGIGQCRRLDVARHITPNGGVAHRVSPVDELLASIPVEMPQACGEIFKQDTARWRAEESLSDEIKADCEKIIIEFKAAQGSENVVFN